jgi:ABC-type multidrug transport system ATPase subunit
VSATGVRLVDVRAGYGALRRRVVLDGVSLEAGPGQLTAVVGPNGAGKTTLFRVLLGFLTPWRGHVEACGLAPAELRRRQGIGYLPESVALPPGYTLGSLLEEGARLSGLRGDAATAGIERALSGSDLADVWSRRLDTFSKGMARRAALAYAGIAGPPLLLLDEPLSGLDARSRSALRETIDAAARDATVIVTSHDLDEVKRTAAVVFVLSRGRVARRICASELADVDLERIVLESERVR